MVRFDLNETKSLPAAIMARRSRWFVGGLAVFVTVGAAASIAYVMVHHLWTPLDLEWVAGVLLVDAMFLMIYLGSVPQADSIDMDRECLRFTYPSSRIRTVRWLDPRLKIDIGTTAGAPDSLSKGQPLHVLYGYRPFQTYLTRDAFQGIVAAAKEQGLSLEEKRGPRSGWTRTVITASKKQ